MRIKVNFKDLSIGLRYTVTRWRRAHKEYLLNGTPVDWIKADDGEVSVRVYYLNPLPCLTIIWKHENHNPRNYYYA